MSVARYFAMRLPTHGIANRNPAIKIRPADILPHRVVKNRARVSEAQLPDLLQVIYGYRGHGDWMTSYYGLQLLALGYGDSLALAGSLSPKAWTDKATGEPRTAGYADAPSVEHLPTAKEMPTGAGITPRGFGPFLFWC